MVTLCAELNDAGMMIDGATFYCYFTNSLPIMLDLVITLYDNSTNNADHLCNRFAQYEMWHRLADVTTGKASGSSDTTNGSLALFSQQVTSSKGKGKEKGRKEFSNYVCHGCSKKGHIQRNCPDKVKKGNGKGNNKQDDKSKAAKGKDNMNKSRTTSGTLYTMDFRHT
jgi:hypothetical protein